MSSPLFLGCAALTLTISGQAVGWSAAPQATAPAIQPGEGERASPLFATKTPFEKLAFEKLTEQQLSREKQRLQQERSRHAAAPKDRIVCGMKVIEAGMHDRSENGIALSADDTDYKIRTIEPPICHD